MSMVEVMPNSVIFHKPCLKKILAETDKVTKKKMIFY